MKNTRLCFAAALAATTLLITPASAQASFHGYVHTEETPAPEIKKYGDAGNWYNGEEFVPRILTLEIDKTPNDLLLPDSTLIVSGSGTLPNSEFLSATLGLMGFEAPTTPYVVLDNFTRSYAELYSFEDLIGFLSAKPDGSVFIIGLDFQTGFIRKEDNLLTYLSNVSGSPLRSEPLETTDTLKDGNLFVIGDLSELARVVVGVDAI